MPAQLGRPRSFEVNESILLTAARLVTECGYAKVSIEKIAAVAGVSKASIYRRWRSKAALMAAVYQHLVPARSLQVEAVGFTKGLRQLLKELFSLYRRTSADLVLGGLIAEAQNDDETMKSLRQGIILQRRKILAELVSQGKKNSELDDRMTVNEVTDLIVAMIWHRLLTQRTKLNTAFIETIIKVVVIRN